MDNNELEIALLKKDVQNHHDAIKRLESHFESERGLSRERGMRVDSAVRTVEILDKIIRNSGQGLVMEVDRLKQASSGAKGRLTFFVSLAAVILSLFDLIMHYLK